MTEYFMDDNEPLTIDWVYDTLNVAHEHDLMHIMYQSIEYITEGDYE